jgi:FkbM family methyltransferase
LAKAAAARDYEQSVDEILRAVFKLKPGAFIDVGANVGQTLIKVLRIDKDRRYIGFEPQTAGCSFIHQFMRTNRLSNHLILPIGLGREEGLASLGLREENDVTASMVEEYRPAGFYSYYQPVPISRGDTVLERLGVEARPSQDRRRREAGRVGLKGPSKNSPLPLFETTQLPPYPQKGAG